MQSYIKSKIIEATTTTPKLNGHKRHQSEHYYPSKVINDAPFMNSMHGSLEKLTIHQPTPIEPKLHQDNDNNNTSNTTSNLRSASHSPPHLHDHIPSSSSPTNFYYPPPLTNRITHLQHHHRSPKNLHARSFSDYTHPYPSTSPPRASGTQLAPLHPTFHRRAVSTNTLDHILQPLMQRPTPMDHHHFNSSVPPQLYASSSTSTVATTNSLYSPTHEESGYTSDESARSKSSSGTITPSNTKEVVAVDNHQQDNNNNTSAGNNKYSCPYCSKGFSRPSSLRIHTYSHTGERPFECPEQGCSRKFSVQSNMRRHLRVHRLGRPLKRNGGLISPADRAQLINKPLAAKPINWVGVTVHHSTSST